MWRFRMEIIMEKESLNNTVLQVEHLHKSFQIDGKSVEVLSDINLEIQKGEFISVVGPSGCGKSTLLKLLISLESITSGKIKVDGKEINGVSNKINMMYQEARLFPWLSAEKNIEFVLPPSMPKEEKKKLVDEHIRLVGLEQFRKAVPNQLSGGMQQRVSIARALVTKPEILLLDEPFGALDAFTRVSMQEELHRIWEEENRTMILVTHDIDEAIALSNRIIVLDANPGRIKKIVKVGLNFPRERSSNVFLEIRKDILMTLFNRNADTIEYYL